MDRGYAGHRPGLTIWFNAEWIKLPQKEQATQTNNVTDPDVPVVPPMATTGTTGNTRTGGGSLVASLPLPSLLSQYRLPSPFARVPFLSRGFLESLPIQYCPNLYPRPETPTGPPPGCPLPTLWHAPQRWTYDY